MSPLMLFIIMLIVGLFLLVFGRGNGKFGNIAIILGIILLIISVFGLFTALL